MQVLAAALTCSLRSMGTPLAVLPLTGAAGPVSCDSRTYASVAYPTDGGSFDGVSVLPPQKDPRAETRAKIDSQLLDAIGRRQGATGLPLEPPRVDIDAQGRALIDISHSTRSYARTRSRSRAPMRSGTSL